MDLQMTHKSHDSDYLNADSADDPLKSDSFNFSSLLSGAAQGEWSYNKYENSGAPDSGPLVNWTNIAGLVAPSPDVPTHVALHGPLTTHGTQFASAQIV